MLFGVIGMGLAIVATLLSPRVNDYVLPVLGIAIGGAVGTFIARKVAMTALPQLMAAFHSLVGLDAVRAVVKVVGFVASAPDFYAQPAVVNGASEFLGQVFEGIGEQGGTHARSAIGVAALPLNAPVEVEMIVRVT